jgi:hypothetical protein
LESPLREPGGGVVIVDPEPDAVSTLETPLESPLREPGGGVDLDDEPDPALTLENPFGSPLRRVTLSGVMRGRGTLLARFDK